MDIIAPKDDPTDRGGPIRRSWRLFFSIVAEVISSRWQNGVKTTDDLIVDLATKGLVLKDTQGTPHYWRVTVDNTGALVTDDLGTTAP